MPRKRTSKPVADVIADQEKAQAAGEAVVADIETRPDEYAAQIENRPTEDPAVEFDPAKLEALPRTPTERDERELPEDAQERPSQDRPRHRHTTTVSVGRDKVHIVDEGHSVGIELDLADKDARPSEAVREILKAAVEGRRGLTFKPSELGKPWLKRVSDNPIGDRMDIERRHAEVVERHREDQGIER